MRKIVLILVVLGAMSVSSNAQTEKNMYVELTTDSGTMVLKLYNETPLHRDNFIALVREGFYDDLLFHRVIANFMIQGGDPNSRNAAPGQPLGSGSNGERIPAEFNNKLFHKKGALAAARDNNPAKASSSCQFYLVQGTKVPTTDLENFAARSGNTYSDEQKAIYAEQGGTPHLDMGYTVFGEVVKGLDVLDKIASVKTGASDRPATDIKMKMRELVDYKE